LKFLRNKKVKEGREFRIGIRGFGISLKGED